MVALLAQLRAVAWAAQRGRSKAPTMVAPLVYCWVEKMVALLAKTMGSPKGPVLADW